MTAQVKLQTVVVHTVIGDFTISPLPNDLGQKIWHVMTAPDKFNQMALVAGLKFEDLVLNAWDDDVMGRQAITILKGYLPTFELKTQPAGKVRRARMNPDYANSRKNEAIMGKKEFHIILRNGARYKRKRKED
jgi:hypothetical protein